MSQQQLQQAQAKAMTVGHVSVGGSASSTWPQQWQWNYPTYSYPYPVTDRSEEYANEVEVERGDYDTTLRFYRTKSKSKSLVKAITLPNGVMDWLEGGS